jgi:phosphopantothenoylcysteine decarboxylase/phosphopantothenate--cysteine ligase
VTVVAANVALPAPPAVEVVSVVTASELGQACERLFDDCDVLLMSAAVADFRPAHAAAEKLKKDRGVPELEIEPTVDVLTALAARRRAGQVLVGFAAEHGDGALAYGRDKLRRKSLDAIVVNDISRSDIGFDAQANEVTIITAAGTERHVPRADKPRVADAVLEEIEALWAARGGGEETDGARAGSAATA